MTCLGTSVSHVLAYRTGHLWPLLWIIVLWAGLSSSPGHAQDVRYISDTLYIPLRSGPGNQYRIIDKGLPSGTRLTLLRLSDDKLYSEVSTERGTTGWVRSQYLVEQQPARMQLANARQRTADLENETRALKQQLAQVANERDGLSGELSNTNDKLAGVSKDYAELESISGNAIHLDSENRRLAQEGELLKAKLDTVQAENQRLQDKLDSDAFMNGALAVLLGVVIALAVPRLWPRRRSNSEWA